jgi:thioredoxin-like negative regulator of GroEL
MFYIKLFAVVDLTIDNFESLVLNRPVTEIWLVDFFASWCGPCIQLAPQWRSLARMLGPLTNINVGSVDCVTQELLCTQHNIRSYPTIRMYVMGGRSGEIM